AARVETTVLMFCPLLSLRHTYRQVVQQATLPHDLGAGTVLNVAKGSVDANEIGRALGLHVAQQLTDSQRELTLLPALALLDERLDAAEDLLGVRRRRLDGGGPRAGRRRTEFGAQP